MNIRKRVTQVGILALGISLVAVLAFAWGQVNPDGAQAVAEGPAMSLGAPGAVLMGETFIVTVTAAPAPDVDIAGFGSEVLWIGSNAENPREGLKWEPREFCDDFDEDGRGLGELQVQRVDGRAIAFCNVFTPVLTDGAAVAVLSEFGDPPIAEIAVDPGSTTLLLELDFVCNTLGSYTLILTAVPGSPDGALYGGLGGEEIPLKTVAHDFDADGDTTAEPHQVADALTLECVDELPPTATPEPTETLPTDLPTDVPQATDTPEPTSVVGAVSAGFGPIDGDGGVSAGLWAVIGAMLAAAATGLIILGWPKRAYATVSAAVATPGPALPATARVGTDTNLGLWPIVGAVMATGLAVFGWKFTRRGR